MNGKRQSKANEAVVTREHDETALDDEQLEVVTGGTAFLSGSLAAGQNAAAWIGTGIGTGDGRADGFIMKDTIIIRTGW